MLNSILKAKKSKFLALRTISRTDSGPSHFFLKWLPHNLRTQLLLYGGRGFFLTEVFAGFIFLTFIALALGGLTTGRSEAIPTLLDAFLYAFLWLAWLVLARWSSQHSPLAAYIRGFGPWISVMLSYNLVGKLIHLVHPAIYDDRLQNLSEQLGMNSTGERLSFLEGHPGWIDFFSLIYLSLFAWLFLLLYYYSLRKRSLYQGLMLGLMMIYAVGFIGYILYPAQGPRYNHPEQWVWLQGGWAFRLMSGIVSHMGAKWDVFPSLHVAIAFYLFGWQRTQHNPLHRVWALPLTLGILVSTIVLGFHYSLDLIGGGILGSLAFILSQQSELKFGKWVESPFVSLPGIRS